MSIKREQNKILCALFCLGVGQLTAGVLFLFAVDGCHHPAVLLAALFRGVGGGGAGKSISCGGEPGRIDVEVLDHVSLNAFCPLP